MFSIFGHQNHGSGYVSGSGLHESGSITLDVELIIGDQTLVMLIHVHFSGKFRQISCETSWFDTKTLFLIQRSLSPHLLRLLGILLIQYFTSQIYPAKDRKTVPIGQVFSCFIFFKIVVLSCLKIHSFVRAILYTVCYVFAEAKMLNLLL